MILPRFFVSADNIGKDKILITGGDATHITHSLRMSPGDKITVCDMHSLEYECVIENIERGEIQLRVLESHAGESEPWYKVSLYQALPKGDKMESIVQKAVETGVWEIVPFISERCISRPDKKSMASKVERWNKIAYEAAKQCGRGIIPAVRPICTYDEALTCAADADMRFFFYECESERTLRDALEHARSDRENKKDMRISAVIGAEGGFSADEAARAESSGLLPTGLGKRILRCETAPIAVLGAISYALEL